MLVRWYQALCLLLALCCFSNGSSVVAADVVVENSPSPEHTSQNPEQAETALYSDRFIFRSKNIDDLVVVLFTFERGTHEGRYYWEFFGAVFEKNHWSFLEGNNKYISADTDLSMIYPSYYAKAEGSAVSGFMIAYDGGDYTLNLSSGPVHPFYQPHNSSTLKKTMGSAEAVLTFKGTEYWGDLIHESLFWKGFNGLTRYKELYKEYQAFYLKTNSGYQVYFHKDSADQQVLLEKYRFLEVPESEGGVITLDQETLHAFKPPLSLSVTESASPPFALYTVPERWEVNINPDIGSLFLWTRGKASINWVVGGYVVMAVEGVIKNGKGGEERIWGFSEYFP